MNQNDQNTAPTAAAGGRLRRVAVFTGSAMGARESFPNEAAKLAAHLAQSAIGIVYGGGNVGLMGVVADAALAAGGEVTGVIPQALVSGEIAHPGLTQLEVVSDMHARKMRMAELGDAFIALPGGAGTLEELFEVWTWQQLGIHRKPVALYDVDGYWEPLLGALDQMTANGFISEGTRSTLIVEDNPATLLSALNDWTPPAPKWQKDNGSVSSEGQ
ncbi:TIGR00730 family Rossman fold protein [Arthrobacter sp. GMC3]|uniref:LOG family protein n=1 Tax=Arthrobacter sp. GMC3 TaxID=2058894 RepID=UPI000CE56FE7|nr:TIGR00730 family Rossman fold protein [Arthrobacter sp. GMC3]